MPVEWIRACSVSVASGVVSLRAARRESVSLHGAWQLLWGADSSSVLICHGGACQTRAEVQHGFGRRG